MNVSSLLRRLILALPAVVGLATCGGDSGGSSPSTPVAPAPAPLASLSWLDVPTEVVTVRVGETVTIDLRLSAAIDPSEWLVVYDTSQVELDGDFLRPGVLQLLITGIAAGEHSIELTAEAEGYQVAVASFAVRVEGSSQNARMGRINDSPWPETDVGAFAFRYVDDFDVAARHYADLDLTWDETLLRILDHIATNVPDDDWGTFDVGDVIEWTGSEYHGVLPAEVYGIEVWGTPWSWADGVSHPERRFPRSRWWVIALQTSLFEESTASVRSSGAFREDGVAPEDRRRQLNK